MKRKGGMDTRAVKIMMISLIIVFAARGTADASGPFGPPQPASRPAGGLHTGIGYWHQEDRFKGNEEYTIRQQQVYSELGYGIKRNWDFYARLGITNLKLLDAFAPATSGTTADKTDLSEDWKFFSTLGAKAFYPLSTVFGIGAFVQGTYYFSEFKDYAAGSRNGIPFTVELGLRNLWDVSAGIGFQATVPWGINLYLGPYVHYAEAKLSPSAAVTGLPLTSGETTLKNNAVFGGFAGIDAPLSRGFRLHLEGKYADRLSAGAAVIYTY